MSKKNKKNKIEMKAGTITEHKPSTLDETRRLYWVEWERIFDILISNPMPMSCDSAMDHLDACMHAADIYILNKQRVFSPGLLQQPTFNWVDNTEEVSSNE